VEDGSSRTRTGIAREHQTGQRGGLVHRVSISGVDDPTCTHSCKRAAVSEEDGPSNLSAYSYCKRLAEEAYGA
jgi:hypothetical protein